MWVWMTRGAFLAGYALAGLPGLMPVTCAALHLLLHISAPASVSPLPSQQPASTSLLLGQRLSKGIILLFPTPLFLHPSVFLFLFLLRFFLISASVSPASAPEVRTTPDTLEDEPLTPTKQEFSNLPPTQSQFLHKPQLYALPGMSPLPHVETVHMAAIFPTSPVI